MSRQTLAAVGTGANRPRPPARMNFAVVCAVPAAAAGLTGTELSQPCSLFPASVRVAAPPPREQGPLSSPSRYEVSEEGES